MKHLILIPISLLLCACGGASTTNNATVIQDDSVFRGYSSGLTYVSDGRTTAGDLGLTPVASIPTVGSAEYRGAMFLGSRANTLVIDAVVGDLTLDFNLQNNTFSGEATDFVGIDSTGREGVMTITNGSVNRIEGLSGDEGSVAVTADVAGSVFFGSNVLDGATSRDDKDLSGSLIGAFSGDDGEILSGDVRVSYEIDPITAGGMTISELALEGYFVAEPE